MWLNSNIAPPLIATVWSQKHLRTQTCRGAERTWKSSLLEAFAIILHISDPVSTEQARPRSSLFLGSFPTVSRGIGFPRVHSRIRSSFSIKGWAGLAVSPLGNSFLPLRASHLKKRVVGGEELSFSLGGLKQPSDGAET